MLKKKADPFLKAEKEFWKYRYGVSFVRYHSPGTKGNVSFRALNMSLEQWGNEGLVAPTPQGKISLVKAGLIRGVGWGSISRQYGSKTQTVIRSTDS